MDRIKEKKGFTLVEVIISMFVFGVGIMAIIAFLSGSVKYMAKLNRTASANQFSHILINFLQQQDITSSYLSSGTHEIDENLISILVPDDDFRGQLLSSLDGLVALGSNYVVVDYRNNGKLVKLGKITLNWNGGKYVSYFVKQ